jgi:hypothetical protein
MHYCVSTAAEFTQRRHMAIPNLLHIAIKHCYSALFCGALKDVCFAKLLNTVVHAFYRPKIMIATEVSLFSYATCVRCAMRRLYHPRPAYQQQVRQLITATSD